MDMVPTKTRKRKSLDVAHSSIQSLRFDDLNQDLLERVLSRLPPSSFFRLRSVCRSWSTVASSTTFCLACSEVQSREPWFLMVGQDLDQSIVFDTSEGNWKNLSHPNLLQQAQFSKSIPVASSGGLVCFRAPSSQFVVCNPVTGACREVPSPGQSCESQTLHAIAMGCSATNLSSYRIVLVMGELPSLNVRVFDSEKNQWGDEFMLRNTSVNSLGNNDIGGYEPEPETVYFLSKAGDVVATNMQRSPSKQYSSVLIVEDGEEVVYFLSQSGTVVACNLSRKTYKEYPRLLPIYFEYSIDLVECNGEIFVIVLSDFLETASLGIWKFAKGDKSWQHVSAMPPSMSHDFFGKKADINCVGCGDSILICLNSSEFSSYVTCSLAGDKWIELPKCFVNGGAKDFMSAFSFEPRVEISV